MHLKADPERLRATATALSSAADALAAEIDALASSSCDLASRWHGDARAAWASRHAAIDAQTRHEAAVLRRTAQRIAQYADDIARTDVDAARAVIGI